MKFPTQHRKFTAGYPKPSSYFAHRDGKSCWVSSGDGNAVISKRTFDTAREAKAWMNRPTTAFN